MKRLAFAFLLWLAACARAPDNVLEAYGEADYIYLASQESGVISTVAVREGQAVESGALVFTLEPQRLLYTAESASASRAALVQAVRAAEADARLAERNFARSAELARQGFASAAQVDADRAARDAANAQLDQARRQLSAGSADTGLARQRLADLTVEAPLAGTIERIYRREGEVVAAGAPVAALLTPANMKVRFYAPQALLSRVPVGAEVQLSCDGCASGLTGRIIRVATEPQFTPPIIYSLEQHDKLVFLVEARPNRPEAIHPGQPVRVRLP